MLLLSNAERKIELIKVILKKEVSLLYPTNDEGKEFSKTFAKEDSNIS